MAGLSGVQYDGRKIRVRGKRIIILWKDMLRDIVRRKRQMVEEKKEPQECQDF